MIEFILHYLQQRLHLFQVVQPLDVIGEHTFFARDHELRMFINAMRLPIGAIPPALPSPKRFELKASTLAAAASGVLGAEPGANADAEKPDDVQGGLFAEAASSTRHAFFVRRLREMGMYDENSDYTGMIGNAVEELSSRFAHQGHSGASADVTIALFSRLFREYVAGSERPAAWTKAGVLFDVDLDAGCLGHSEPDEPVFILCGRDLLAGDIVREWADRLEMRAAQSSGDEGLILSRKTKIEAARMIAAEMDRFRIKYLPGNNTKWK